MLKINFDQEKFDTLIEINADINSSYDDGKVLLNKIVESATILSEGEASSLMLLNLENNRLYFDIALGTKGDAVKKFSLQMGEGIAGWVAENNRSVIVNDVNADQRFNKDISQKIGYPTHSILAVPMRIKGKCIGVLEILNKKGGKQFSEDDLQWLEIFANQAALAIQNAKGYEKIQAEIDSLQKQVQYERGFHPLIFKSKELEEKLEIVDKAAKASSSILLLGESGVGKELFAEQIHLKSDRADKAFIRVNCAALPETLLESELFGHVKGAFTDANMDRRGRFELADEGTIFLDEIGDLPLKIQTKLLRVIQNKTFEKLGSNESIEVDARIIAATNKDIEKEVQEGRFRADLYYRLNVLPIYIPPLRLRKDDISVLSDFFLKKFNSEIKKQIRGFSNEAMAQLLSYSWPGNVRELENTIERAVVISQDEFIKPESLILNAGIQNESDDYSGKTLKDAINMFKKHFITKTLISNGWKQTKTARVLGIQRTYLSRLIKELEINRK